MRHASKHAYVIALGSNMRVPGVGGPRQVLAATVEALKQSGIFIDGFSRIMPSVPVGPSQRAYANAAALVGSDKDPPGVLAALQAIETDFGRRRMGARWRRRPLDLDIILWNGGLWMSSLLTIPHPLFRQRDFVLRPAAQVAPDWRDPLTSLTLRQLAARVS